MSDPLSELVGSGAGADDGDESPVEPRVAVVLMRVGQRWLAAPAESVLRVTASDSITRVPGLPEHFLGVALVYGRLIAVIELARLLHIDNSGSVLGRRLVVVGRAGAEVALMAEQTRGVVSIPMPELTGEGESGSFVSHEVTFEDARVAVLDVSALLEHARRPA